MCHEYKGEESNDYRMKIDLPPFNRHLHNKGFLDWVTEDERFFKYVYS